jgi:SAM-dependent methyltransferase
MTIREAVALIEGAVPRTAGAWADVGAGRGAFTAALAELLEPPSRIYAIDRDAAALAVVARRRGRRGVELIPVAADFTGPFALPGLAVEGLHGMLLANALHYARDAGSLLGRLVQRVRPGGRVVLVEYEGRSPSRWVPYPISLERLPDLAEAAGLSTLVVTGRRPSAFGGVLYAAAAERLRTKA